MPEPREGQKTATAPTCIGIIMDGNRRWAKMCGRATLEGHTAGRETLKECLRWAKKAGVTHLIFYAFSTENWKREASEVKHLIELLEASLKSELQELQKEQVRIRFIGEREQFSKTVQTLMEEWERDTAQHTHTVVLALSYGGRSEIVRAVDRLIQQPRTGPIHEEEFSAALDTAGIPDPDLIIRTGGQRRLSNFLPWQCVYSELFFTETLWPDFTEREFTEILAEYAERTRNFGK